MDTEAQKRAAAEYAAQLPGDGMVVGLGSGTTAHLMIEALSRRVHTGLAIIGVPTSTQTEDLARSLRIPLGRLDDHPRLDLTIDGADEVDPRLNLIKGGGGALLREKLVALAAARYVIIVDSGKRVLRLGTRSTVPIEVAPFGWTTTRARLEDEGFRCLLRGGDRPFRTDGGNYILDCQGDLPWDNPRVAHRIKLQTGVVDHGLFLDMATEVVVGLAADTVEVLRAKEMGAG